MHRPLALAVLSASVALAPITTLAQQNDRVVVPAAQERQPVTFTIYDLRDLAAALPPDPRDEFHSSPVNYIANQLAALTVSQITPLQPGVYAVIATDDGHARLTGMFNELRQLYTGTYQVEVIAYSVDSASRPRVGDRMQEDALDLVCRSTAALARRTPTPVQVLRETTYIREVQPIVATSAVGYQPQLDTVSEGLMLQLTVGAGPDDPERVRVQAGGTISQVTFAEPVAAGAGPGKGADIVSLPLVLPIEYVRTVSADTLAPYGVPTVVAVVDGFEHGRAVAIAVRVDEGSPAQRSAQPPAPAQNRAR